MTDAELTTRIRLFREPMTLILIAAVSNFLPRQWAVGIRVRETMASDAAWAHGNRVGAIALVAASAVWMLAAVYLPRPYVKPVGVTAVLVSMVILFWSQGWVW